MSIVGTSSQTPRFSPDTLPGLTLWLDAADSATFNGGATWTDKSGTGNHGINGTPGSSTMPTVTTWPNGLTAARFVKASKNSVKTTNVIPTLNVTYFFVVRLTGADGTKQVLMINNIDGRRQIYTVASSFPAQVVALHAWPATATNIISAAQSVPFLYSATLGGGLNLYANGTELGSGAFGDAVGASQHYFGAEAGDGGYLSGDYGEILIYSTVLTTAQRQQVEGYLARKWGISELIGHPYRIGGSGILPNQISGCTLWLDAADATTLTLSGSNVTAWANKSGTASLTLFGTAPTYVSNQVVFNSSGRFRGAYALTTQTTIFAVYSTSNTTTNARLIAVDATNAYGNIHAPCPLSGGGMADFLVWTGGSYPANEWYTTLTPQTGLRMYSVVLNGVNPSVWRNGSAATMGGTSATATGNGSNIAVGADLDGQGPFNGAISELILFSAALTDTQRQQVEGYLANKWGLSTRLPGPTTTTPYAGALLPMRPFSPLDIDGLSMWLDAADATTVTLSGSNVTAWADKSGRGYSLTVPGGGYTSPTYSNGVVTTTGSNALWSTSNFEISGNTPVTLFLVGSITSSADIGPGATLGLAVGDAGNRQSFGVITYQDSTRTFLFAPTTIEPDSFVILTPNISGQRYVLCGFYTGSAVQGTYNGTLMSSQSTTLNLASRPFQIGMRNANTGTSSAGTICECVCYTGALSTTQRQQVEMYLADKWGLRGSMGGVSHPHRFGPPMILPPQISGCSLWLDAADATTLTLSGSNVTAWADKSGNGRNFTRGGTADRLTRVTVNGNPVVYFNNDGGSSNAWLTGSLPFASSSTFIQVLTPLSYSQSSSFYWAWALNATGNYAPGFRSINYGTPDFQPYVTYVGNNNNGIAVTYETPYVSFTEFTGGGANTRYSINGTITPSSGTIASNTITPATFHIGGDGLVAAPSIFGRFYLSEFIVFSNTLTTLQRQQVEGYLAWKWGLSTRLPSPTTSWLQVKRALTPAFTPTQIPGCSLWLDAADATTLTLSGSNVTAWSDKSGNGNNATTATGTLTRSSNSIVFTGSQAMTTPLNSAMTTQTIFVVASADTSSYMDILGVAGTSIDNGLQVIISNNYRQFVTRFGGTSVMTGGTVTQNTPFLYGVTYISGGNSFIYLNGSQTGSNTTAAAISGTGTVMLGAYRINSITDEFYNGRMNEVLVYNQVLSTSQRQRIEGYLAEKWGLRGSLGGLNHPSRFGPPVILPTQISGCALWLDAADTTTVTLSGSNVTAWNDKSGNGRHATQATLARSPTYVGSNTLRFVGASSNFMSLPNGTVPFSNNPYSVFFVTTIQASGTGVFLFSGNNSSNSDNGFFYENGAINNYWQFADTVTPSVYSVGTRFLFSINYTQNVNRIAVVNGTISTTTPSSNHAGVTSNNYIGAEVLRGYYSTIDYNELLIFSNELTTAQRQQVEGYLAWKWGLQTNLPSSTHPYRTIKP
jgi:hypothetical protein